MEGLASSALPGDSDADSIGHLRSCEHLGTRQSGLALYPPRSSDSARSQGCVCYGPVTSILPGRQRQARSQTDLGTKASLQLRPRCMARGRLPTHEPRRPHL